MTQKEKIAFKLSQLTRLHKRVPEELVNLIDSILTEGLDGVEAEMQTVIDSEIAALDARKVALQNRRSELVQRRQ